MLLKSLKKVPNRLKGQFIDSLRVTVHGGHGGNGFPKYGGVGGQGGCVYFVAKENVTLKNTMQKNKTQRILAGNGEHSSKERLLGRRGVDKRIEVPIGITVIDDNGKELGNLNEDNSHCIAAGGGVGGCVGNSFLGQRGDNRTVTLDLKLIADVGLVGFPNAGKSTLLKAISNASPKIASFPFTTIRPQVGTIDYKDYRQITIADLPGLIEGAHINIGMGRKFLKHIERTRLLLMIVDIFGFKLSTMHTHRSALENIYALNKELELYNETLLDKPCILLLNKIDEVESMEKIKDLKPKLNDLEKFQNECPSNLLSKRFINFDRILEISAKDNINIDEVKRMIRNVLDEHAERKLLMDSYNSSSDCDQNANKESKLIY